MKNKSLRQYPTNYLPFKKGLPSDIHIMNKNEAKAMRKIKAETRMTEEQIRNVRKYRIILADARREGSKANEEKKALLPYRKYFRDLNWICWELKLPVWHEKVEKAFFEKNIQKYDKNNQINKEKFEFLIKNFKVGKHL